MRYICLALAMFVAGVGVTQLESERDGFTPVVRLRTVDGMFLTFVHPGTVRAVECRRIVHAFSDSITRVCPQCRLDSSGCQEQFVGVENALAQNEIVPFHTVEAPQFRIAVAGPPDSVLARCRLIAQQIVFAGVPNAICREPFFEAKAKSRG